MLKLDLVPLQQLNQVDMQTQLYIYNESYFSMFP